MQVLNQELERVTNQIEKLSFYKDKLVTLISATDSTKAPNATVTVTADLRKPRKYKGKKAILSNMLIQRIASYVAEQVRRNGYTKTDAISNAIITYKLPKTDAIKKRLCSSITPSVLGKNKYNELFKGTKYVAD